MTNRLEETLHSISAWLVSAIFLGFLITAACGSEPQVAEQRQGPTEEKAPSFELPEARGGMMSLRNSWRDATGLALVFYRGFF